MLISKTVIMIWSGRIKQYYIDKGYVFTKILEEFEVKVEDLLPSSNKDIKVICDYCGESTTKPYYEIKKQRDKTDSNKDCCKKCAHTKGKEVMLKKYGVESPSQVPEIMEKIQANGRIDFSIVKEAFKKAGYELISTKDDYKNASSLLKYICPNHILEGVKKLSYHNIQQGKGCNLCGIESRSNKRRLSGDFVYSEFINKGYEPQFKPNEYKNAIILLPYICSNHREEGIKYISYDNLRIGHGCSSCSTDNSKGDKSCHWNPLLTDEERLIQRSYPEYYNWRKEVLERDWYTCQCCGKHGGKLNVHHFVNYSQDIEGRLDLDNSITLCREDHILFHKTYGYQNNTKEQYEEFKSDKQLNILPIQEAI